MPFWNYITYQFPLKALCRSTGLSDRSASEKMGLSRVNLANLKSSKKNITLNSLSLAAQFFERKLWVMLVPKITNSSFSTVAVCFNVIRDGPDSWKIHMMDLVDEFRQTHDPLLLALPPLPETSAQLKALLASTILTLCEEAKISPPSWAEKSYFLESPWFLSGMQSLKATALLESPFEFRKNNIFVQSNFLERA